MAHLEHGVAVYVDTMIKRGHFPPGLSQEEYFRRSHIHYGHPEQVVASLRADLVLPLTTDLICQVQPGRSDPSPGRDRPRTDRHRGRPRAGLATEPRHPDWGSIMTTHLSATETDVISHLAGIQPGSPLAQLRAQRSEATGSRPGQLRRAVQPRRAGRSRVWWSAWPRRCG